MSNPNRKVYGLSLGAILPALGFSLTWFCCLPIAAGALGVGAAALGAMLTPLRPYLTTTAVALLSAAIYQTYKPRKGECADGSPCAIRKNQLLQRLSLWVIT